MAKFIDAAKQRRSLVENILNYEVFGIAQSLAQDQYTLYHGTKSSILSILQSTATKECLKKNNGGFIIELSMLFRKTQPSWVKTFDVITDRYFTDSLKEGTRRDRGSAKGLIFPFHNNTVIPSNF